MAYLQTTPRRRGMGALRIRGLRGLRGIRLGDDFTDYSTDDSGQLINSVSDIAPVVYGPPLVYGSNTNVSAEAEALGPGVYSNPDGSSLVVASDGTFMTLPAGTPASAALPGQTNAAAQGAAAAAAALKSGASIASINAAAARVTSPYALPTATALPISNNTLLLVGGGLLAVMLLAGGGGKGRR